MFLALRDLVVARGRFALMGVVIALVALLTTLLSGLAAGLVDDGISGLRRLPLTHLAFQSGAQDSFSRSSLTERELAPYRRVDGVQATPLGVSFFNARTPRPTTGSIEGNARGASTVDLALFGVEPGSFLAPRADAQAALGGTPGLVLSDDFRSDGIRVGDVLTVVGPDVELPVLGFTYAGSYGHVPLAFTDLGTWQQLVYGDNARGRFSAVALDAPAGAGLSGAATASGTEVRTKVQAYQGSPGFAAETSTMTLIRGFLLFISALIVGAFFTVWTVQRAHQIGLMKALGASNGYVVRDALGQLALVLVAATGVGVAAALALGSLVGADVPFSLTLVPVLGSAAVLVLLGMAGSLVAIRRITSVDPIVALGAAS